MSKNEKVAAGLAGETARGSSASMSTMVRTLCFAVAALYRRLVVWWLGYDFFISYCHESESYATALYSSLSRKHVCFLDRATEGIQAGESIGDSISKGLKKSRMLVVVISPAVATNEWPRAECRYFSAVCPKRRLIPISPNPYSDGLPQMLFGSDLPTLQKELERWVRAANTSLPESFVPVGQQLAIVEGGLKDLRGVKPSSNTVTKLHESFDGTSVPTKARWIVGGVGSVVLSLGLGFWMYYAAGAAANVVGILQQSPYGSANVAEAPNAADEDWSLRASFRREHVVDAARANELHVEQEWMRLRDLLDDYQFYRWWSTLGIGYKGIALELHNVPDLIPQPSKSLPPGIVDLRLYANELSSDWIRQLRSAKDTKLLSISAKTLEAPEQLAAVLGELRVSELRLSQCGQIKQSWFDRLNRRALNQLSGLRLSKLPEMVVQSPSEQRELEKVLSSCPRLNKITLDQLSGCRFSPEFFPNLIQSHPGLCNHGTIEIDPDLLAEAIELPSGCSCEIKLLEFPEL